MVRKRIYKGHNLVKDIDDYTVLDIETTSLDSYKGEILEISAIKVRNKKEDTLRISRRVLPHLNHHKLDNLIDYFNLVKRNEHRALNDCILTNQVYINLANYLK